jgi:hypothetical protein
LDDERYELQAVKVVRFFHQHPGLVISLFYVLLTACGLFYSASFYREFDISILKLANISDVLTVGLSEPAAIIVFAGGLVVALFTDYFAKLQNDSYFKWKDRPKSFRRWLSVTLYSPKFNKYTLLWLVVIFFLYGEFLVSKYAVYQAGEIKQGVGTPVQLHMSSEPDTSEGCLLLGSTSNFFLCYSLENAQAVVLPIEGIAKITPDKTADESPKEIEESKPAPE